MSNPVRNGCPMQTEDGTGLMNNVASWAGSAKKRRRKITLPKQWNLKMEGMDTSIAQETPPNRRNVSPLTPELTNGIHSSCCEDSDDDGVNHLLCVDVDNYRRFSCRMRKTPDFFHANVASTKSQPETNEKRHDPPARRALRFTAHSDGAPDPSTDAPTPREILAKETKMEKVHVYP